MGVVQLIQKPNCNQASPSAGIQDISVYKNELFCLHVDGKISHLSLVPVDRCVERLIKRDLWGLAARVCHIFQNAIVTSKVGEK